MSKQPLPDLQEREKALDPTQSFIVQAPAGSGKTSLLIQRYLTLLAGVKTPEALIAITFTRKAAQEMRTRVLEALQSAKTHQNKPPQDAYAQKNWALAQAALKRDADMGWQITQHPHRLKIMTIDAFCADLVRQMPLLSHLFTQLNIAENPTTDYESAATAFINTLDEGSETAEALQHLLEHLDNNLSKVHRLLVDMLAQRDQWLPYIAPDYNDLPHLRKQLEKNLENLLTEKLASCRKHFPTAQIGQLLELIDFACSNLAKVDQEDDIAERLKNCQALEDLPEADRHNHPQWQTIAEFLLTKSGTWRKNVTYKLGFPPSTQGENKEEKAHLKAMKAYMKTLLTSLEPETALQTALTESRLCPYPKYQDSQWTILCTLLKVLPALVAHLALVFREKNNTDFCEIALAAQQALGTHETPSDLALALDYSIQHILVDEFQDTSSTQYRLLEKLIEGWQNEDGHTLFLVGDPMQSIYRFRQAEVNLFLRTRSHGIAGIQPTSLTLSTNFRATDALIQWTNHTCQKIFPAQDDFDTSAIAFSPSSAAADKAASKTFTECKAFTDKSQENAHLVATIKTAQTSSPEGSIAILVRSRTHLQSLLPALKQANISYQGIDIEYLGEHSVVRDLFALTQALFNPLDRTAWLAILRAPWCGLTLADLYEIAKHTPIDRSIYSSIMHPDLPLSQDAINRLTRITPILAWTIKQRARQNTALWIQGCWHALGGPACLTQPHEFEDASNYFALLVSLEQTGPLTDLELLSIQLDRLYAKPITGSKMPVQIMTIHRAKGLEFDTVILPALEAKPRANTQPLLLWEERHQANDHELLMTPIHSLTTPEATDPIYQYLRYHAQQKDSHETTRLLYVAMTRARQALHLLATIQADQKGQVNPAYGSFLSHLWPALSEDFTTKALHVDTSPTKAVISSFNPIQHTQPNLSRLTTNWQHPVTYRLPQSDQQTAQRANNLVYPPTSLAQHIGTIIHQCLEKLSLIDNPSFEKVWESLKQHCSQYLKAVGISGEELHQALTTAQQAIRNTLQDSRGLWILSPNHQAARSEYHLTIQQGPKTQRMIIDRTFIDETNTRWIIDYKITPIQPEQNLDAFSQQQAALHQSQLQTYTQAFISLENHPIKTALYFPLNAFWIKVPNDQK